MVTASHPFLRFQVIYNLFTRLAVLFLQGGVYLLTG